MKQSCGIFTCCTSRITNYLSILIHIFVIILVVATGNALNPFLIVQVPDNGFHDTIFEFCFRSPSQFTSDLGRVDGITLVVSQAVFYKCNQ